MVAVRWAGPADAAGVANVHVRAWRVAYQGLVDQAYLDRLDPVEREEVWRQGLARYSWPERGTLVAEQNGEIIGFAHLSTGLPHGEDGEIHAIYATPDAWGTGVGRALMGDAIARLKDVGCTEVVLWVLATNERARRFYEKGGWHADGGEAPHDVGGAEHIVVRYRLRLAGGASAK